MIHILDVNVVGWLTDDDCQYVGRRKNTPYHLGNPFCRTGCGQYYVTKKEEELIKYRPWLKELIECHKNGSFMTLEYFERIYLNKFMLLTRKIEFGEITKLLCNDFHQMYYFPVKDGEEKSHAEILYKECVRYINERRYQSSLSLQSR